MCGFELKPINYILTFYNFILFLKLNEVYTFFVDKIDTRQPLTAFKKCKLDIAKYLQKLFTFGYIIIPIS